MSVYTPVCTPHVLEGRHGSVRTAECRQWKAGWWFIEPRRVRHKVCDCTTTRLVPAAFLEVFLNNAMAQGTFLITAKQQIMSMLSPLERTPSKTAGLYGYHAADRTLSLVIYCATTHVG